MAARRHLLVWDAGCSWLLWKGYLKSSLLPLLPELTRITLMGLVLSPILREPGRSNERNPRRERMAGAGPAGTQRKPAPRPRRSLSRDFTERRAPVLAHARTADCAGATPWLRSGGSLREPSYSLKLCTWFNQSV